MNAGQYSKGVPRDCHMLLWCHVKMEFFVLLYTFIDTYKQTNPTFFIVNCLFLQDIIFLHLYGFITSTKKYNVGNAWKSLKVYGSGYLPKSICLSFFKGYSTVFLLTYCNLHTCLTCTSDGYSFEFGNIYLIYRFTKNRPIVITVWC